MIFRGPRLSFSLVSGLRRRGTVSRLWGLRGLKRGGPPFREGVKGLIKNFELRINSMENAGPAVVEGEGLGEGLANDVARLVGKEELRVKRDNFDREGGALGGEVRIEGFQMKEDCLFGLEHLGCALAGNGDENDVFWFHIDRILKIILVNKKLLFATLKKSY